MVRRDWCVLSADLSSQILDFILAENQTREDVLQKIHDYLREKGEEIRSGKVMLNKYIITKGISKKPEEYPDKKCVTKVWQGMLLIWF